MHVVRDRLKKEDVESIKGTPVKLFDFAVDADLSALFEAIGMKVELVKPHEIPFHMTTRLNPQQLVVINNLYHPQPKEVFAAWAQFVADGGKLLIFNSASHFVAAIFPGKVVPAPPSTAIDGKLRIASDSATKSLFSGYTTGEEISLEYFRYPIQLADTKGVKVLAKVHNTITEPLLVQFDHGSGTCFLFVSKMYLKEDKLPVILDDTDPKQQHQQKLKEVKKEGEVKEEKKEEVKEVQRDGSQAKKRVLELPFGKKKRKVEIPDWEEYLASKGASDDTRVAWKCAMNIGFVDAFLLAKRCIPFIELLTKLIIREKQAQQQYFASLPPPQVETSQENSEQQQQEAKAAENGSSSSSEGVPVPVPMEQQPTNVTS